MMRLLRSRRNRWSTVWQLSKYLPRETRGHISASLGHRYIRPQVSAVPKQNLRPYVLSSRCLLGDRVRYDGRDKRQNWIDEVKNHLRLVSWCPEVEAGLAIPRPPMDMYLRDDGLVEVRVEGDPIDFGPRIQETLETLSVTKLQQPLDGAILKSKSPSCALTDGRIEGGPGVVHFGRGVFVAALLKRWPTLPCVDDATLQDPQRRAQFISAVRLHHDLRTGREVEVDRNATALYDRFRRGFELPKGNFFSALCAEGILNGSV